MLNKIAHALSKNHFNMVITTKGSHTEASLCLFKQIIKITIQHLYLCFVVHSSNNLFFSDINTLKTEIFEWSLHEYP